MTLDALIGRTVSRPLLCLEVNPPRGTDVDALIARLESVNLDCVNITDCALAKIRLSGLMFGAMVKARRGIEPLVNLSCRDRNSIGLQSDLLGAWSLGIRSVVCLTGDAVTVGDSPDAKGVFEMNSIGLLRLVASLNSGRDLVGGELKGAPAYVPGVVVNPNVKNPSAELKRLTKKREAGATYALSQPVFDPVAAESFFREAQGIGVQMMVGLHAFRTAEAAEALSNVPGIRVPESLLERVRAAKPDEVAEISFAAALETADRVRPYVRGYHVISGATAKLALELTGRLDRWLQG